jgi:hypothetical protein
MFVAFTAPGGLMGLYDEVGIPALELRLPWVDGQSPEQELPKWAEVAPRFGLEVVCSGIRNRHEVMDRRRWPAVAWAWRSGQEVQCSSTSLTARDR